MVKKNFTRKELSKNIFKSLGFSKNFSSKFIDSFFDVLSEELFKGNKIKLSSFGTFKVVKKNERIGRNPKTKVESKISPRRVVKFQAALNIKLKINKK